MALRWLLACSLVTVLVAERAYAWGERGHDLVARVAARLVVERAGKDRAALQFFLAKEHQLGHLANVPDIVWRNMGKDVEDLNGPTHYMDLEYVDPAGTWADLPKTPEATVARLEELCAKPPKGYVCPKDEDKGAPLDLSTTGSAPFRVRQLFNMMKASFERTRGVIGKEMAVPANEAILYGGTMAHFVGDLGQPLHATTDYDGWSVNQGGLHGYFESDVVDALDLTLDADVFKTALQKKPFSRLEKVVPAADKALLKSDPFAIAAALMLDSRSRVKELLDLDRKTAVTKPSQRDKGMKVKAERKPAAATTGAFRGLVVERLATAADTLATLWVMAWEQAGKPDLSGFKSYDYATAPAFIKPDYLPAPKAEAPAPAPASP